MTERSEEAIQEEIVQFLQLEGWTVFVFAPPRNRRGGLAGSVPSGWPDLLAVKENMLVSRRPPGFVNKRPAYLHLEVKRPGGRLSPAQKVMHENLVSLGCRVYTVTCAEDCAVALSAWGCEVRTRFRHEGEP
mgnify:CR=1 FL=1